LKRAPIDKALEEAKAFPRRFRRGLIEAHPKSWVLRDALEISAAIPPRPH